MTCRKGSGGRGFTSGAGETELQLQRRRLAPLHSLKITLFLNLQLFYAHMLTERLFSMSTHSMSAESTLSITRNV